MSDENKSTIAQSSLTEVTKELDIYRDTSLRYCGKIFQTFFYFFLDSLDY